MGAWEHHLLEFAYFLEYNIQSHLKLLSLSLLGKAPGLLFQIDYQEVKVRMKLAGLKVLRGLPEVSEGFEIEVSEVALGGGHSQARRGVRYSPPLSCF